MPILIHTLRFWYRVGLMALALCSATVASAAPRSALSCETRTASAVDYIVCSVDPAIARPQLFWKGAEGKPYLTFAQVAEAVGADGSTLVFAMNAGMYAEDFSPMGLLIVGGETLHPINRYAFDKPAGAVPNFYKMPNGVFFIDENGPAILPTERYAAERRSKVTEATQSGPMLVIDGALNPIFIPGSTDRRRRSGVGICAGGLIRFAISEAPVNFHDFASLFRDDLACANALFLDGGRGAGIYVPALDREDLSGHGGYGPIVGLVE